MPKSTILPLALLYTQQRSSVDGATRFQKLVFLAQQETDLPETYKYHADDFGPFSPQLHVDLTELSQMGLLERNERTNEIGHTKYVYSITPDGIQKAQSVLQSNNRISSVFDALQGIKRRYNEDRLQDLLRYVYRSYPTYTTETKLDTDRLFDPDTRSQFLEGESESGFIGTAPGEWMETNSSAENIFSI